MQQGKTSRKFCVPGGRRRWRQAAAVIMVLMLPGLLGAWRIVSGDTIDRRHVERIQDGKTTKNEILLIFGDPKEIDRSPEGVVYTYKSFKDAPANPYKPEERQINPQSDQLYVIDSEKKIKKAPLKTEGQILKSTLVIRFKPGSDTVMSHEYKEF
jgi:hypothetical protein